MNWTIIKCNMGELYTQKHNFSFRNFYMNSSNIATKQVSKRKKQLFHLYWTLQAKWSCIHRILMSLFKLSTGTLYSSDHNVNQSDMGTFLNNLELPILSKEHANSLGEPLTSDELHMHSIKCPITHHPVLMDSQPIPTLLGNFITIILQNINRN